MYETWLDFAVKKMEKAADRIKDNIPYQSYDGKYRFMNRVPGEEPLWSIGYELMTRERIESWTNGFWGGILWLLYDKTGKECYRQYAEGLERRLDPVLDGFVHISHDAGFMWMHTSNANYTRTGSEESKLRILKSASHLAGRFNPAGSFIRAQTNPERVGWTIIDCMMNLPLLYTASKLTGDPRFANVAIAHANTMLKDTVRADGSCFHIVTYDPVTGVRTGELEGQGYSKDSAWSRGMGWAIYGFALSGMYTGDAKYFDAAERCAKFFMAHLPPDGTPRADLLAPLDDPDCFMDSSAASIAAAGLVVLSKLTGKNQYREDAIKLLHDLQATCVADETEEALLLHGNVGYHRPISKDIPLIYGDFFYLEALCMLDGASTLF